MIIVKVVLKADIYFHQILVLQKIDQITSVIRIQVKVGCLGQSKVNNKLMIK